MSIRSQDDFELLRHIEVSWQSIQETVKELERRNRRVRLKLTWPPFTVAANDIASSKWVYDEKP